MTSTHPQQEKHHLAIFSVFLTSFLCLTFVIFQKQDAAIWQQLNERYQQQLLQQELPLYLEFVARRWEIERKGSSDYLNELTQLNKTHQNAKLANLILSDALFYPYIRSEGHILMPSKKLKSLLNKRQKINDLKIKLSESRFALWSGGNHPSRVISHIFVDSNLLRFASNLLIFLLFIVYIERKFGAKLLFLLIFISSISSSTVYLLAPSTAHQNLQSLSGVIFGLSGFILACVSSGLSIHAGRIKRSSFVLLLIFILIAKLFEETLIGLITQREIVAYLFTGFVGATCFFLYQKLNMLIQQDYNNIVKHEFDPDAVDSDPAVNWKFRVSLSNAMALISQFKFDQAREALHQLRIDYPNSALVLEQQYHLEKIQPDDGEYWQCANALIDLSVKKQDYARMKRLFSDIQKNAATKQRARISLKPESYHKMMMVFIQHDDLNKAEQAFLFLELEGKTNIIKDACTLLIDEFKVREMLTKTQQYQMLYERLI